MNSVHNRETPTESIELVIVMEMAALLKKITTNRLNIMKKQPNFVIQMQYII